MKSIQHKIHQKYDDNIYNFWKDNFNSSSNVMISCLLNSFVQFIFKTTNTILDESQFQYLQQKLSEYQLSKDKNTVYLQEFEQFIEHFWKIGSKKQKVFKYDFQLQTKQNELQNDLKIKIFNKKHKLLKTYVLNDKELLDEENKSKKINNLIRIGSDKHYSDITIKNEYINSKHLQIQQIDGKYVIQDISQSNYAKFKLAEDKWNILQDDMAIQIGQEDIFVIKEVNTKKAQKYYEEDDRQKNIVQYNTQDYNYQSLQEIMQERKLDEFNNNNFQFQIDGQPNLIVEFTQGFFKNKQFNYKVINKCQEFDEPCIIDSTLIYKKFQTHDYYESKTNKFYENQDIFVKHNENQFSIINNVFYRLQIGKFYENINNVIPLKHFSVEDEHCFMAFSEKYGWFIKEIQKSKYGTYIYLKNRQQMQNRYFSNVFQIYNNQEIHFQDHYIQFEIIDQNIREKHK